MFVSERMRDEGTVGSVCVCVIEKERIVVALVFVSVCEREGNV